MDELGKLIKNRINLLRSAINAAENEKMSFPEGSLRVSGSSRYRYYYNVIPGGRKTGEYISANNKPLAALLAQKDYNRHFLKAAQKELAALEKLEGLLMPCKTDSAFTGLCKGRQEFVKPYIVPDEIYLKNWLGRSFQTNLYHSEYKVYSTKRGEKVRSKSEAIIANIIYDLKIPYHYEKPLKLKGGTIAYPDFTLLDLGKRKEKYWEHFGLISQKDYFDNALQKLDYYSRNGIHTGDNLIITFETEDHPLDADVIANMLRALFPYAG